MSSAGIFGPLLGDAEVAAILGDDARARAMVTVEIALAAVEGGSGSSTRQPRQPSRLR